jgi:hypothetical protein
MVQSFTRYLDEKGGLTPPERDAVESVSTFKKIRKGQYLLEKGIHDRFFPRAHQGNAQPYPETNFKKVNTF